MTAQIIDLTTLSAGEGFIIQGDEAGDQAGYSVSNAGDVNGDGIDDLIVGADRANEAYVIFGRSTGFGVSVGGRQVIDLTNLSASDGFVIQGDMVNDYAGRSVSSAGDINGDGIDDLIVGAPRGGDGGPLAGEAYVVFGRATGFGVSIDGRQVLNLSGLSPSDGFVIQGAAPVDLTGYSVSTAGDVNGDGVDDLIVSAHGGDNGGDRSGEAYVIFGGATGFGSLIGGRQVIDLTSLSASDGFIIQGDDARDYAGRSVSNAGDVNGDGIDDLIIGASQGSDGGPGAGEAYVVFGRTSGFGSAVGGRQVVDLTNLSASDGFIIQGDTAGDQVGISVSNAGDVNGDGIDDLIVGANAGNDGGTLASEAYVIFGRTTGFGSAVGGRQVIDLTSLSASDGFIIQGDMPYDQAGRSVSAAGDVNGDGIDDLIIGAAGGDGGGNYAGEAYVILGRATGFGSALGGRQVIDLTDLSSSDGFIIQGDLGGDAAGNSVSAAGDVNGDGIDDLIVGAPGGDDGGLGAGEAYVIFGSRSFGALLGTAGDDVLTGTAANNIINGLDGDDRIIGAGGDDTLNGGSGSDTVVYAAAGAAVTVNLITGTATGGDGSDALSEIENVEGSDFPDLLTGNSENNILDGGNGDDVMAGGTGDDVYVVDGVGDTVVELADEGIDTIRAAFTIAALGTNLENVEQTGAGNINGTGNDLANQITGNAGNNRIDGGAGDDTLAGGLGNDTYVVDSEFDTVIEASGAGVDAVESSAERFALSNNIENLMLTGAAFAGTGNALGNRITGTNGDNSLDGAAGADVLQGLGGNDSYYVDNASDRVVETLSQTVGDTNDAGGVDTVFASVSYSLDTASNVRFVENLSLLFATGNVNGTGNALANVIEGNTGNNILDGGAGNDVLVGYGGNDIYLVDAAGDVVTEGAGAGTDTVRASVGYTLSANVENLQLQGTGSINGIGNGENNALTGTSGNNRLEGLGGNDVIDGGLGADTMLGGAGDDSYIIDNGNDRVFETLTNNPADTNDAGGTDTVSTSITINMNGYNGIRFVERAVLTGTASIGITGNALANHITGNTGNNTIDGGEGADTMIGGRGNDIYTVDSIGDVVTEVVGQGFDTVRASINYTLGSDVEDLVLTGSADLNGNGNTLANRLTGNAGNNILDGGGGTDTLIGGAGNDTYIFDSAGDRAVETVTATVTDTNDAGGIDQIFSGFSVNLAQSNGMKFIENVTLTGTAAAAVYGNDLGNSITANSGGNFLDGANGNDVILGLGGNDTMLGGSGADTLDGGAGRDRLTGGAGQDILTGGTEADTFVFASGDMGASQATADRIADWSGLTGGQGDRIDLSAIDANTANGSGTNEAFSYIGTAAFSNVAGQLRSEVFGGNTYLMADTNGDGIADLWLQLDGTVSVAVGDLGL